MQSRQTTTASPNIGQRGVGYAVNAVPDEHSRQAFARIQQKIVEEFGDVVWTTPPEALHITLLAWLTPLVDYGRDVNELFDELYEQYDAAFGSATNGILPVEVCFDTLKASTDAIIAIGHDDGQFEHIRRLFVERADLLPKTKLPPAIIHTSLARYQKEYDLQLVQDFIAQERISINFVVSSFQLVKETVMPMLEREVIKEYRL